MTRYVRPLAAIAFWLLPLTRADVRTCQCDISRPETLQAKECALCVEVEKHPPTDTTIFIRDANPTKPNRWLALPRFHGNHPQQLLEMPPEQRAGFWRAAIDKGRAEWGDAWGIALNATDRRSQCHVHFHIGKLLPDTENDTFVVIDDPAAIPVPHDGDGIWLHPVGARYHAHVEPAGELKLQR